MEAAEDPQSQSSLPKQCLLFYAVLELAVAWTPFGTGFVSAAGDVSASSLSPVTIGTG